MKMASNKIPFNPPNPLQKKIIAHHAKKLIAKEKRTEYFKDDNAEYAIIKMLNSGLGRKGLRQLAKKMKVSWKEMKEMIDTMVEFASEDMNRGAKQSIRERYKQEFLTRKKSMRQLLIADYLFDMPETTVDEAEAMVDKWFYPEFVETKNEVTDEDTQDETVQV